MYEEVWSWLSGSVIKILLTTLGPELQYTPKKSSHYDAVVRSDRSKISTVVLRRSYGNVVPPYRSMP